MYKSHVYNMLRDGGGWGPIGCGTLEALLRARSRPGQSPIVQQSLKLIPTAAHSRGGYAVTGLGLADLMPNSPGDELVVGTLAGDLLILSADNLQEIWRTRLDGSIACYNSIRVEDLNLDGNKELYVAGSKGLWRFVTPQEVGP